MINCIGKKKNEICVGNVFTKKGIPKYLSKRLKSIRLGNIALDVHGVKLDRKYVRPLLVSKDEFEKYNIIKLCRTFPMKYR